MKSYAGLIRMLITLGIAIVLFLAGCGGSTASTVNNQPPPPGGSNPTPTITTISPTGAVAGGAAFTLTVNGTNFVAASAVNEGGSGVIFGGIAVATTFVSATQLTAAIPASAIASAGTVAVTVINPGGFSSNPVNFAITSGTNPIPTISFLNPSIATFGEAAFTLEVDGSNLLASSVVQWNGSDRPTTFVSSGVLTAQISASDVAAAGTAAVTVFNPAPGGGSSNSLAFTIATGGVFPQAIVLDPTGKFAYVANSGTSNVSMYTIDGTTGTLTLMGRIALGGGADSAVVHPSGKFVYVASGTVSMYAIDSITGALAPIGSPVAAGLGEHHSITVDHLGKFAYVTNDGIADEDTGSVSMYTINATTGALTSTGTIDGVPFGGGLLACPDLCAPYSLAVDPSGMFVYVVSEGGPAPTLVSMWSIDANTGALTFIATVAGGGRAVSVAVDPKGNFAYVADNSNGFPSGNNNVSAYTINAGSGGLTFIRTIGAGTDPTSVAVDPTGKFAYVINSGSNDVSMYSINTTTGALTSVGTIAAGTSPISIAMHPSGKFAYVTNSGSNNVSMYRIDTATGALTLIGTISS